MSGAKQQADGSTLRRSRRWLLVPIVLMLAAATWYVWHLRSIPLTEVPDLGVPVTDPDVSEAIQTRRDEVSRRPESGATWGKLAQIYHVHNYLNPALLCYAEAARREPANPDWPYLRALILLIGERPADAFPDLRRAAELERGERIARLRLGELFLNLGQTGDAADAFRAVLVDEPSSSRAHLGLAQVAAVGRDWEGCLAQLADVSDVPPARRQAALLRLASYQHLGRVAEADRERVLLEQLPEADPPWPDPVADHLAFYMAGVEGRLRRARQMMEQREAEKALDLLSETVGKYPNSAPSWTALGRCRAIAGNLAGAEQALLRSVQLVTDTADVWTSLGYVRWLRGNPGGALEAYRTVIRLKPTDADAHTKVGDCLAATGDPDGAVLAYQTALRYDPNLSEAREKLGKLKAGN